MNWSKGLILGATVTTSSQYGFLLVAFLALFVRMVGGHFWSVLCFIMHQLKADSGPQDGLHHQHQLILRNSQSHTSTLWELIKLPFFWRSNARYSLWRTLPLMFIALLQLAIFTTAGLFSSHIASSSDEVLVRSPYCGYMQVPADLNSTTNLEEASDYFIADRTAALWSSSYAQNCYRSNATTATCNIFAVPRIQYTSVHTSCPFAGGMCVDQDEGALQITTEYINSDIHLGVNSRRRHSIDYRRITTCAPLRTENFADKKENGDQYYYFGEQLNNAGDPETEWTFSCTNSTSSWKAYYLESVASFFHLFRTHYVH